MPNTALNRTTQVLLTNKSGGAVSYGNVVIVDTTTDSSFTTTTTGGISTAQLGVVLEPNGIASNALGMVAVGGWAPRCTLNTAATRGQFIKSHTVAGQGTPHSSPQVEGDFAVALEASANPALAMFGSPNGPLSGGTGTVTHTAGALTANAVVVGNASADITVLASLGTSGQVLTSNGAGTPPSFQAGASGALVLLEQHTASTSSTLDFTTCISSTYDEYIFEGVDVIAATNGASLNLRVGTGVGPTYDSGSNYNWTRTYNIPGNGYSWAGSTGAISATAMTVMALVSSSTPTYFTLRIKSPQNASYIKQFQWEGIQHASDGNIYANRPADGVYSPTTALTAFRYLMSAGNITSGTIRCYGVAK